MKELSLKEFYAQSLELKAPRKLVDVKIDGGARLVRIRVECAPGEVWGDPDTNERAEIKDWEERTWRHLDCFAALTPAGQPRGWLSPFGRLLPV